MMSFCSGVPVSSSSESYARLRSACFSCDSRFLSACASSTTTYRHRTRSKCSQSDSSTWYDVTTTLNLYTPASASRAPRVPGYTHSCSRMSARASPPPCGSW